MINLLIELKKKSRAQIKVECGSTQTQYCRSEVKMHCTQAGLSSSQVDEFNSKHMLKPKSSPVMTSLIWKHES